MAVAVIVCRRGPAARPACAGTSSPIAAFSPQHPRRPLFKRRRLKLQRAADTRPRGSHPQQTCGILATERRCQHQDPSADQARAAIQTALGQIGFALPGTITIRRARCGKPRCACAAEPPALHGPYIQWTRTVHGKTVTRLLTPGPVPGLRALVRQRPPAPGTGRRTANPVPGRNGQGGRLGHDHPRHPGAAPHPPRPRPEPELPQTTQNAGRSARLTREQPSAEHP